MKRIVSALDNPLVFIFALVLVLPLPLYFGTVVLHKIGIPGPATLAA